MGTRNIPYKNLTDFYLIAKNNFEYSDIIPAKFDLISIEQPNFSLLDKFLIKSLVSGHLSDNDTLTTLRWWLFLILR